MFRERLASVISKRGDMAVCGEADNVRDAIALAEKLHSNIAIVDITLRGSNGLDFLKDLKAREIDLPVLVLSMHDEAVYAERVLRAGARGYITKYEASSEVMAAIEQVLNGEVYLSRAMTNRMLGRFAVGKRARGRRGRRPDGQGIGGLPAHRAGRNGPGHRRGAACGRDHGRYLSGADQREAGTQERQRTPAPGHGMDPGKPGLT